MDAKSHAIGSDGIASPRARCQRRFLELGIRGSWPGAFLEIVGNMQVGCHAPSVTSSSSPVNSLPLSISNQFLFQINFNFSNMDEMTLPGAAKLFLTLHRIQLTLPALPSGFQEANSPLRPLLLTPLLLPPPPPPAGRGMLRDDAGDAAGAINALQMSRKSGPWAQALEGAIRSPSICRR